MALDGSMYFHPISATKLSIAATQKYILICSTRPMKSGKRRELASEPSAPAVFMAAESVPEYRPLTSQQTGQLALTVKSPRSFCVHEFETLKVLCEAIIPADRESGGAIEAGCLNGSICWRARTKTINYSLLPGLDWLDAVCVERYGGSYLACISRQHQEILTLIAFRINGQNDPRLIPGIEFCSILRKDTVVAFLATEVGRKYLGFSYPNVERIM
jgi:hypothetical protein